MKKIILYLILSGSFVAPVLGQKLIVSSPESSNGLPPIKYGRKRGHASVVIESSVENLEVSTTTYDSIAKEETPKGNLYTIDVNVDSLRSVGDDFLRRVILLSSPSSSDVQFTVPSGKGDLQEAAYYYTVTLPERFPRSLSLEWLLNNHSQKGIRISYGGRYGFYIGGTLGKFCPSGDNIDDVVSDCDLSYAKVKGYICTTIFGGMRMGLLHRESCTTYLYVGAGYGEYGKQWENKLRLENSRFFYSDYIRGVNMNCGISLFLFNTYYISLGGDAIMQHGKYVFNWQLGAGLSLNTRKWFKYRKR